MRKKGSAQSMDTPNSSVRDTGFCSHSVIICLSAANLLPSTVLKYPYSFGYILDGKIYFSSSI